MPRFRFRAQAALDLRVREHEQTLRALARAESDQLGAQTRVEAAQQALAGARQAGGEAMRSGASGADLHWHRMWMIRLDHERAAAAAVLAACDAAVATARSACVTARQRRESLERFREKLHHAHVAAEAETERKMLDELATRRFAVRGGTFAAESGDQSA